MTGCDITQRGSEGWGPWCDTRQAVRLPLPPSLPQEASRPQLPGQEGCPALQPARG